MKFSNGLAAAILALLTVGTQLGSVKAEISSAKDLFLEQLESPKENINTGLKYWIQLRRNGRTSLVDNRTTFLSGDQIRFLIIPNISGYAYIALVKGSSGQQKVLFPNKYEPKGKMTAGRQHLVPASGFLQFDKHPGIETILLVVSRRPVAASALMDASNSNCVRVEQSAKAELPLQTQNCVLTFGAADKRAIDFAMTDQKAKESAKSADMNLTSDPEFSKDLNYVPSTGFKSRIRKSKHRIRHVAVKRRGATSVDLVNRPGSVTIINIEPNENLGSEIQLVHK